MPDAPHRAEGFPGQHLVVLPEEIIEQMRGDALLGALFPTAAGCFPEAPGHLVERPCGLSEAVLIICRSGNGWVQTGGRDPLPVGADTAVVIPPRTPHRYGADAARPWSIMWAHFSGEDAPHYLAKLGIEPGKPLLHFPAGTLMERAAFAEIYERLEDGYTQANLLIAAARLRLVLAELNRHRSHPALRSSEEGVQWSVDWMRAHIGQTCSLAGLARIAGLSVPHYSERFRRKTGFSPVDYFLRLKVQRACRLLDTTSLRIAEVAAAVGFGDPYYFSRLFKKMMRHSPRDYRKIPKG